MEKAEIEKKLTLIFRDVFKNSSLELNENFTSNDIENWDSLNHMLMILEVEETFGIKFKLKDLNKMKKVGDIVSIIEYSLINS